MKAQLIILTLFLGLITTKGYSQAINKVNSEGKVNLKKYDFNLFKFYQIDYKQPSIDTVTVKSLRKDIKRKAD